MNVNYMDNNFRMEQELNGMLVANSQNFYNYRVVDLTAATGITSWDEFIKKYSKVTSANATVEFHSHDNDPDNVVTKYNLIENIDLIKTIDYNRDIEQEKDSLKWDFSRSDNKTQIMSIFKARRMTRVKILFQSYIQKDSKHLMFRICQETFLFSTLTTIGCTTTVWLGDELIFS